MLNRRDFLGKFTLLSTALTAPSFLVRSIKAAQAKGLANAQLGNPNRILVVIELAGGCDGLNTVVPYTNDVYYASRPELALQQSQGLLTLDSTHAFHPAMTGFHELYSELGGLAVVQGVGYPNPNRSHFRSMDIWHTAEPDNVATDGWLASYFDQNPQGGSLQGLNLGGRVPRAMVSDGGASPSIQNIETYQLQTDPRYPADTPNKNAAFQELLSEPQNRFPFQEFVTQTVLDATVSSIQLLEGRENYTSTVEYPQTAFANNLRNIAQIIAADLGVTVFYTSINGFDTHANQIVGGNNLVGTHSALLGDVSQSVKAFYDDMKEMGRDEDVLIMTFSEFGRRLSENGSLGTDHGTANQMFVIGTPVAGGMYGSQPSLSNLDPVGDMIYTVDFRSVYASVLANWLGADPAQVLGANWLDPQLSFV